MKKIFTLLILLIAVLRYAGAQPAHLSFDHLNIKTGLPENQVSDIMQDKQGYMWLTTQNGMVRYDGYRVKVYKAGIEDKSNVPTYQFTNIFLDKKNELWVNSYNNGLFEYDRSADKFVQHKNTTADNKGNPYLARIDSAGKIWSLITFFQFVRSGVLQQFDPATGIFKRYGNQQKGNRYINCKSIFGLFIDSRGRVWLNTDNGFYLYNTGTDSFTGFLATADTLRQGRIDFLYQPRFTPGKIWVTVAGKNDKTRYLLDMDIPSGRFERFKHLAADKNSLGNDAVLTAVEDEKRQLWLGTGSGISLYDGKSKRFTNYIPADTAHVKNKNHVFNIKAGNDGNLWMLSNYGLLSFNPATGIFHRYVHEKDDPASLGDNHINTLVFDREGTLWMGLYFDGADRINPLKPAFALLSGKKLKFPWHDLLFVTQGSDKKWWIGARNGLFRYNPQTQSIKLITRNSVRRMTIARNGVVYYTGATGTTAPDGSIIYEDGLYVYYPATGKTERYKTIPGDSASLSSNNVRCLMEDHTGIIWVGTYGAGICAFNPHTKKFKRYPYIINDNSKISHNMLDDAGVVSMYEDTEGTLWVGTDWGGLNHFDRKRDIFISSFMPQEGVNVITSINQDSKGRLWVATFLNGLFMVDNHTGKPLKRITEKNGLLHDQVLFIHADKNGFLWLACQRGFSRLNTGDLSIKNYKAEGNNWDITLAGFECSTVDIDGNILFFGWDKMVLFDPEAIVMDKNQPVVHIETVACSDARAVKDSSEIIQTYGRKQKELPYNQNKVTFNYVALHYINPAENKYAFRLTGYDNHWVQPGTQRTATYTNLSPGTYTFQVIAANSDGVWNYKGDSFTIVINPPWWLRWWAWALYVVLFAAAVYSLVAYRSRKLIRDKRMLEHKVHIRTEEVLQQKEEIEAQRDNLERAFSDLKTTQTQLIQSEKMASLGELTAGIAHEIQNPLNFVNNFSEVNTDMIGELEDELNSGNIEEALSIAADIKDNEQKINHHGKRADAIVKAMLQHSRSSSGQQEPTNINTLADEYLRLAYHGLRAKDKSFNAITETNFDKNIGELNINPQDIGRVILNLLNNAFYAVNEKKKLLPEGYEPTVTVSTKKLDDRIEVVVRDNGDGIPSGVLEKIYHPFFTTKPTGQGTGLGLSMSYDIVKAHGGELRVETKEGEFTEFIITLPS